MIGAPEREGRRRPLGPSFHCATPLAGARGVGGVFLVVWALAAPASAYVLSRTSTGTPLRWKKDEIIVGMAEGGSHTLPAAEKARSLDVRAMRRAFQTWEAVAGSRIRYTYQGRFPDADVPSQSDGINTVSFFSSGLPADLGSAIAVTEIIYSNFTGEIFDADIYVNERDFRFSTFFSASAVDLESVLLHEGGHLLGLDHTCGLSNEVQPSCYLDSLPSLPNYQAIVNAVMYPARSPGDPFRRALSDDDVKGIVFLYPADSPIPAPRVDGASPMKALGATTVTIQGANFDGAAKVTLEGDGQEPVQGTLQSATAGKLVLALDPGFLPSGCYDLVVTNPSGKKGALFGVFAVGDARCEDPAPPGGCSTAAGAPAFGPLLLLSLVVGALARRRRRA